MPSRLKCDTCLYNTLILPEVLLDKAKPQNYNLPGNAGTAHTISWDCNNGHYNKGHHKNVNKNGRQNKIAYNTVKKRSEYTTTTR